MTSHRDWVPGPSGEERNDRIGLFTTAKPKSDVKGSGLSCDAHHGEKKEHRLLGESNLSSLPSPVTGPLSQADLA
jgi:hypothetical protein